MNARSLIPVAVAVALGVGAFVVTRPTHVASAAVSCGVERWAVKTLSDKHAKDVNFHARRVRVNRLRHLQRPADIGEHTPRQRPYEFRSFRVRARLKAAAREDDHDYHVIISPPHHPGREMITELPDTHCKGAAGSIKKRAMARARNRFENSCGPVGASFKGLSGIAVVKGVAFFDIPHGQSGAAPNYIELHPVLKFRMVKGSC